MISHCHFIMTWADRILKWFHGAVFLPPPQPSQSEESLQSILWMCLSWLISIYTLEKLASGWSPSASPLLGRSHATGWAGPAEVFKLFGGCGQVGREETTCLIVIWRPFPLKDLSSSLWRAFSPKWVMACKELTNFHWRFPGRKRSPFFWNHHMILKALTLSFKSLTFSI